MEDCLYPVNGGIKSESKIADEEQAVCTVSDKIYKSSLIRVSVTKLSGTSTSGYFESRAALR
jgi:hypothetical protein